MSRSVGVLDSFGGQAIYASWGLFMVTVRTLDLVEEKREGLQEEALQVFHSRLSRSAQK